MGRFIILTKQNKVRTFPTYQAAAAYKAQEGISSEITVKPVKEKK